ncbi:MAG: ATP-dependent helicase, partial [Lachnospiraceae bacterium]|nr:ATP-dependent helicase [Lachnospiraceae bacterium]
MASEITSGDILTTQKMTNHIKVYAGPGAGKTHFLVENIKSLVTENPVITSSKIRKVLCITYTNAAVNEIIRRLEGYTDYVEDHTIHGFIIEHIIKPFQHDLVAIMKSDFNISVNQKGKISSQTQGLGILHGIDKEEIFQFIKNTNPKEFENDEFGYSKMAMGKVEVDNDAFVNSIIDVEERTFRIKPSGRIKQEHLLPLKKYMWSNVKKLTHNEILYFGYRILEYDPTALYTLRVKFPFIFVDEFQDTNPLQTLLIKMIGQKSSVIGVVGDIAQSIYSFQGAKPSDLSSFKIDVENDAEYLINGNRRSSQNIVNFCNFLRQSDTKVVQRSGHLSKSEPPRFGQRQVLYYNPLSNA